MVDLDLRKASLSKCVDGARTGAANYLAGQVDVDAITYKPGGKNHAPYDIIPVGTIPPNPAELLASDRLVELLERLRNSYDYVFIDCPPIEVVADTAIVSKHVDMTLFVVRAGLLDRSMLPELDRIYNDGKYKNIYVILNGTETAYRRYGYHKYGYSYGYNYGYGGDGYYSK